MTIIIRVMVIHLSLIHILNPLYEYGNSYEPKYLMADEYLSGNVREKLKIAKNSAEMCIRDRWKGACGHEWQTSVKARSSGEKCPICSGARVIARCV